MYLWHFVGTNVVPIVIYGIQLYGASSISVIDEIEKILKYFTRRLWIRSYNSNEFPDYHERLARFSLVPLEVQRIRFDMMLLFRVVRNLSPIPFLSLPFSAINNDRLIINRINTKLYKRFFLHRSTMLWNKLVHIDSFKTQSMSGFKQSLYEIDLLPFTEGCALKAV